MISTSESFCYCLSQDIGVMDPDGYEKNEFKISEKLNSGENFVQRHPLNPLEEISGYCL